MFRRVAAWWRSRGGRQLPSAPQSCEKCGRPATVFDLQRTREGAQSEHHYCEPCARNTLWLPNPVRQGSVEPPVDGAAEVRVEVEELIYSGSDLQVVILRESDGPRRLSFGTGPFEVSAIWWALKREPSPRPLTHQAWLNSVVALGAIVQSVCVLSRREEVYFAEIRLLRGGTTVRVDARPSDALLIALAAGVPFLFAEGLLATDGVSEPKPD